jgi:hypothetical protein
MELRVAAAVLERRARAAVVVIVVVIVVIIIGGAIVVGVEGAGARSVLLVVAVTGSRGARERDRGQRGGERQGKDQLGHADGPPLLK